MSESAGPGHSQYAAVANIPLIQSPSLRVPNPIELPPDIHPLPDDINAYFVYPFNLEPHIMTLESSRQSTLAAHASRRDAFLRAREEEKERRKREALRRVAPGFEPSKGVLTPTSLRKSISPPPLAPNTALPRSIMDDLVDQLEAMDTAATTRRSLDSARHTPSSSFSGSHDQQHFSGL
ncbi:hypothetical protein SISSUDRAFT_1008911 [Sistotremastrum suecicum HHB10207 ss-3]|uniref:Uncharacterized protein n=1 Tax=Sistotremastrum suecicum HHB10207 ss-3 TaxID=1314776 RepID=A0A166AH00_9AGAM|nr:hypothetical protein SISSUDRAFT_1008911 [Sistotremastrum suecicum HHB10207 ss-3]